MLASVHWQRVDVTPMDPHYEILGFYRGPRMVASVSVGFRRQVVLLSETNLARQKFAYGSNIANDWRVLAALTALFILMSGVWPVWRLRNLDVLVAGSLVLSVVLYNAELLTRMVWVTYPALLYLAARCAWRALCGPGETAPAEPLYDRLTRSWGGGPRLRVLRLTVGMLALVTIMVGLSSPNVLDVGYAVMEGATGILHGLLPYGHIPDVLHGDTYPIGSYLLYVPLAWFSPVHNVWDNADLTLLVAVVGALLAAAAAWRIVNRWRPVPGQATSASSTAGLRMAIAVLAFPPMLVTVSTGTTDVALAAMLLLVFVLWHRPGWGMAALSAAAWFKAAPVALVPLLFGRLRGRAWWLAGAGLLLVSAAMLGVLVALGGLAGVGHMLSAVSFQFTRSSPHTLWTVVGSVPLQQLAEALTLALVAGAFLRLRRDRGLAADPVRFAALAAAVLLGVQIAANYWNYMYLAWAGPLIALSLFVQGPDFAIGVSS